MRDLPISVLILNVIKLEIKRTLHNGHLYTVQLCRHFVFRQVDIMGGNTWDQNYAPGLDFLVHILQKLQILASYNKLRIGRDSEFAKF